MGFLRLFLILWIFGFIIFALAATSSYLYSTEEQPARADRWLSRVRMAMVWPFALLSSAGRSRLRRG